MRKQCDPLTSSSVTVLSISIAAPEQLGSALTAHHTASNLPHIFQEKDADVGVAEQECEKQLFNNTVGTRRHAIESRGTNIRLGIEASWVCSNYKSNTYVRYRYYKCTIFVTTRKRIRITKQYNTQSKSQSDTDVRREDNEM